MSGPSLGAVRQRLGPLAKRPHVRAALELLGAPGSRDRIPTPAAVVDLDAFDRNIAKMVQRATAAGLILRPHAKSHKCAALAHRQILAGAAGVCCAKLAEAEALAAAGIDDILITSPIVGSSAAGRVAQLAQRLPKLKVVVDHVHGVAELAAAAATEIQVLLDVDPGIGRTGVRDLAQAKAVIAAIANAPRLRLVGLQCYGGTWQHVAGADARAALVETGTARIPEILAAAREIAPDIRLVTGGGTGTFAADAAQGRLTEIQPGSFAFMDREYRDALGEDVDGDFEQSLTIHTTVVSDNQPNWVTLDGGFKAFSTDGPAPIPWSSRLGDCAFVFFGDEHALLGRAIETPLRRGDRVAFVPGHVDPTLDRYDILHLVQGDRLVDIVPIEARGASQ